MQSETKLKEKLQKTPTLSASKHEKYEPMEPMHLPMIATLRTMANPANHIFLILSLPLSHTPTRPSATNKAFNDE